MRRTASFLALFTTLCLVGAPPAFAGLQEDLSVASAYGHLWRVKALVDAGADINARDPEGYTALTWAAQHGHTDIADYLMGRYAQVNAVDRGGYTPLMWAAQEGHANVVETLLRHGANPYVKDGRGNTPLTLARMAGNTRAYTIIGDVMNKMPMRGDWTTNYWPGQYEVKATNLIPSGLLTDQNWQYRRSRAHSSLMAEGSRFFGDYRNYVNATASHLGWTRMYDLNDPDMEIGKHLTFMYANLKKGVDLTRARRDWGRARSIQDVRGESLFQLYMNRADRILQDAGY